MITDLRIVQLENLCTQRARPHSVSVLGQKALHGGVQFFIEVGVMAEDVNDDAFGGGGFRGSNEGGALHAVTVGR